MGTHPIFESDFDCLTDVMGTINALLVQAILILFIGVGFLMNFFQLLSLCLIWPISARLYRQAVHIFQFGHWSIVAYLGWYWSGSEVKVYCSDEDLKHIGKESAVWVANHRYSLDFLSTVLIPDQFGFLGFLKAFQKSDVKFMPVVGWNFWFTENIFLKRQAARDIAAIQNGTARLVQSKLPFWLVLYAEGTRFSKEKHEASEQFAREKNYESLKHHIQPRPTGFTEVVKVLKAVKDQEVPLYDMTVKLVGDTDRKMSEVIARKPVVFHCFIRRIRPEVVPEGAEADWLRDLYQEKDKRFQILKETDTLDNYVPSFPAAGTVAKEQKLPKPVLSKYMYWFWFMTVLPVFFYVAYRIMMSSLIGLLLGISVPIICQVLTNRIIRSGDMKSSSAYGLKKSN